MRRFLTVLWGLLAWTSAAHGEAPTPRAATAAPRPEFIEAARREGDTIIASAKAEDLFDNETGKDGRAVIVLRHRLSGFACEFEPGRSINGLNIYPNAHRGSDVGCNTIANGASRTTNFTRDATPDAALAAGMARAIQLHVPGLSPAPDPVQARSFDTLYPDAPKPTVIRFVSETSLEEDLFGHSNGWFIEDRITAPRSFAQNNLVEEHWYAMVSDGLRWQASAHPASADAPKVPAMSAQEETAIAQRAGDRILVSDRAGAQFENVTTDKVITLRHKPSGVICRFQLGEMGGIARGKIGGLSTRNDAVNCLSGGGAVSVSLAMIPNTGNLTLDAALSDAVTAQKTALPGLQPAPGGVVQAKVAGAPDHRSIILISAPGADQFAVHIAVAVVDGWVLAESVRGPATLAKQENVAGELELAHAMVDVMKARKPPAP